MSDVTLGSELDLDIRGALRQVDSLVEALQRGTTEVPITADASAVTVALEAAVESANLSVELQADASTVTASIEEAVAEAEAGAVVEIPVGADTAGLVDDVEAAVAEASAETITVGVDAEGATEELAELSSAATSASASVDNLSSSGAGFGAIASAAGGSASGLGNVFGDLDGKAAVLAGTTAALTAVVGGLFSQAIEAQGATLRFEQTLGDLAGQVERIDVGNLDADLSDLALTLGSDDDAMRQAAASMFQLGIASGSTREEAAETSETLLALAARAVALNPALGDVGAVAENMSTALARGGRFASNYGIALTGAEIEARALADTGKATSAELTLFEKAAAGAAIAAERYGDSLDEAVTRGAANPIIQLRQLTTAFGEAAEEIGAPLVAPILDLLKDALPIATNAAAALADVAKVLLPIVSALVTVLSAIPQPLLAGAAGFLAVRTILGPLAGGLETLAVRYGLVAASAAAAAAAQEAAAKTTLSTTTAVTGPFGIAIAAAAIGVGLLASSLASSAAEEARFQAEVKEMTSALRDQDGVLRVTEDALAGYIETSSAFQSGDQIDDLRRLGLGFTDVADLAGQGAEGLAEFVRKATEAGEIDITGGLGELADVADLTTEQLRKLARDGFLQLADGSSFAVEGNEKLLGSFVELQDAAREAASVELDRLAGLDEATEAIVREAEANHRLADGSVDVVGALGAVNIVLDGQREAAEVAAAAAERLRERYDPLTTTITETADALVRLQGSAPEVAAALNAVRAPGGDLNTELLAVATNARDAALSEEEMADAAATLGVGVEELGAFIEATAGRVEEFANKASAALPTVADAFKAVGEDSILSVAEFVTALDASRVAMETFRTNLATLAEAGFGEIAATIAEQGPEIGGALATELVTALQTGNVEVLASVQASTAAFNEEWTLTTDYLRDTLGPAFILQSGLVGTAAAASFGEGVDFGERIRVAGAVAGLQMDASGQAIATIAALEGEGAARAYGLALDLPQETIDAAVAAGIAIRDNAPVEDARAGGASVGGSFLGGFVSEIMRRVGEARAAGAALGYAATAGSRTAIRAESPSRVMEELGGDFSEGFALGIEKSAADAVAAAEALSGDAAAAVSVPTLAPVEVAIPSGSRAAGGGDAELSRAIGELVAVIARRETGPLFNVEGDLVVGSQGAVADLEMFTLTKLAGV